jgi:hypothetical protein
MSTAFDAIYKKEQSVAGPQRVSAACTLALRGQ